VDRRIRLDDGSWSTLLAGGSRAFWPLRVLPGLAIVTFLLGSGVVPLGAIPIAQAAVRLDTTALTPLDVKTRFTLSNFRRDPVTQMDLGSAKVTNIASEPLAAPIYLVVRSVMPAGTTVVAPDGQTTDGKAYYDLSALMPGGSLAAGASIKLPLQVRSFGPAPIQLDLRLYSGVNHTPLPSVSMAPSPNNRAVNPHLNFPPVVPARTGVPTLVGLTKPAAMDLIRVAKLTLGSFAYRHDPTFPDGQVIAQTPAPNAPVAWGAKVDLVISIGPDTGLPPNPATVAPLLDGSVSTSVFNATEFLYIGIGPIQTGVNPTTIAPERASALRGRTLSRDGQPLAGVVITVLKHPEFGQTVTRPDGQFDMVVNGGSPLTLAYQKSGYLPAQRLVNVPWQDYVPIEDVVLIQPDPQVNAIDLTNVATMQVAVGSPVTDADGSRQATLLFTPGTQAQMVMPDGSVQPLSTLHVRATEYTIGANGPNAMPAPLPPMSGYTYAVELSADEAHTAGAASVSFSQPVILYAENFLGFPTGDLVPVGYYDRNRGVWVPSENGRVIAILGITQGLADIDVDGDGVVDDAATVAPLGVTNAERAELATRFQPGQLLWRVALTHFSPWDCNWGGGPPPGASPPNNPPAPDPRPEPEPCQASGGSTIDCENQILGEFVPIVGTPFSLNYRSSRVPGRQSNATLDITLSGATIPSLVKRIDLEVEVSNRVFHQSFAAAPNQLTSFTWDGMDAYGRPMHSYQSATVRIGYVYDAVYYLPKDNSKAWATVSGIPSSRSMREQTITLWQEYQRNIGVLDAKGIGLGGWDLSVHHALDPAGVLYLGNAEERRSDELSAVITTVAGNGTAGQSADGLPATSYINGPQSLAVSSDGSFYMGDQTGNSLRRVAPDSILSTISGLSCNPRIERYCRGAVDMTALAVGPDDSVYVADAANSRVWRVSPNGAVSKFAGSGAVGPNATVDGVLAVDAPLYQPVDVAVGSDGTVYIADAGFNQVFQVGIDGVTRIFAGSGRTSSPWGDDGPAVAANLSAVISVAVGVDGSLYVLQKGGNGAPGPSGARLRRVGRQGIITTIAGGGSPTAPNGGDGGPATQAWLASGARDVVVDREGNIYIADQFVVRVVRPDASIQRVAGIDVTGHQVGFSGEKGPPTGAKLNYPTALAAHPDGSLLIADANNNRVRKISALFTRLLGETELASEDSSEIYVFGTGGRHLRTLDALTGAVQYAFTYDSAGRLLKVTDGNNNETRIEYDAQGEPIAVMGPYGQRTTLTVDANGYLASITDPAGGRHSISYLADGLLTSFTDPRGNRSTMGYDPLGRLARDDDAAGGFQTLSRSEDPSGFTVTRTTALGRSTLYRVEQLPGGTIRRTVTAPSGTVTKRVAGRDGNQTTTNAAGSVTTLSLSPDPRFGMFARVPSSLTMTTGGITLTTTTARDAVLANPSDPLSLTSLIETTTLNGRPSTSQYDAATRTLTRTTAAGRQVTGTLDAEGRLVAAQMVGLAPMRFAYDGRGRLDTITQSSGTEARTTSLAYNPEGYLDTLRDPLGRVVTFTYNPAGRVIAQSVPDGRATSYSYDPNGNLTAVIPPSRRLHGFSYTPVDLQSAYIPPNVGAGLNRTDYAYNIDRDLEWVTRPDGLLIDPEYNAAGERISVVVPQGRVGYSYDPTTGKLTGIATPDGGTLAFTYNGTLLTAVTWGGAVAGAVGYAYDNDGRAKEISLNRANPIAYGYDADSLLTQAGALSLTRDAQNGLLTGSTLGSVIDAWTYSPFGEVASYTAQYAGSPIFATQFTRDALGRITQKVETIAGVTTNFGYRYDLAGRLQQVKVNGATAATYAYDANGSRLSRTTPQGAESGTYDAQDRLLNYGGSSYIYTDNGEPARKTTGGQTTTYQYDVLGNLRRVTLPGGTIIDYVTDGQNRRIGKKVNGTLVQGFLFQDQLKPVAELDGGGNMVAHFVYATRINVPDYMIKSGTTYRIVTDHLGSPRLVVETMSGNIVQRMDYDEFGTITVDTNPGFQPFGFSGGVYDSDTHLLHFDRRDYDSSIGRWLGKDPILFRGNDPNLYQYVLGEPINKTDPTGTITWNDVKCWWRALQLVYHLTPSGPPPNIPNPPPKPPAPMCAPPSCGGGGPTPPPVPSPPSVLEVFPILLVPMGRCPAGISSPLCTSPGLQLD
jgi:RHS repeat-associated protein